MINKRRKESEDNESSGELIIINEFENTKGIKEIEKGQENLLKDFHQGLGARIRELDLIHSAILADVPTNLTDPRSGIYCLESQSQLENSNLNLNLKNSSGIDHPSSDSGIKVPNSSVTPPVLESGSRSGSGTGPVPGPIGPRVSFGQIGFERTSRPSSNQRIREQCYLNDCQEVSIHPYTIGGQGQGQGQGRVFDEYLRKSNNNNYDNNYNNNNNNDNNNGNDDNNNNQNMNNKNNECISIFDNNRYYDFKNSRNNRNPPFMNNCPNFYHNGNHNNNNNNSNDNDNNSKNNNNDNYEGYKYSNNNFVNNNNSTNRNYQNNGNFGNTSNQNENDNQNNRNNRNNNNGSNGNKKTCVLGSDVQFHPYAQHPYVPSLGPNIMHSNILTVSKG